MVHSGIAAAILPKQFIQTDASAAGVTLFALEQHTYIRQSAIVTRRGQYIPEYAQYAMDFLKNQAGK